MINKIEEIVKDITEPTYFETKAAYEQWKARHKAKWVKHYTNQLLFLFQKECLEIIGSDEKPKLDCPDVSFRDFEDDTSHTQIIENRLRSEQREQLKEKTKC